MVELQAANKLRFGEACGVSTGCDLMHPYLSILWKPKACKNIAAATDPHWSSNGL